MKEKNDLFAKAMEKAAKAHAKCVRKGSNIPYIVHPFEVAVILRENGMTEEVVAAGLLHDSLEDTVVTKLDIKDEFGEYILNLVIGASERLKDREDRAWEKRKEHTIEFLKNEASFAVKCIACADKLSNARSILRDLKQFENEKEFWDRFNAKKKCQKWYYKGIVNSLQELEGIKMYQELKQVVENIFN